MKKRFTLLLTLTLLLCVTSISHALAATSTPIPESGLLITPVQQFLSAGAGGTKQSTVSIANLTDKPMDVTLLVKQFSVTDYTYDYKFQNPANNWLRLEQTNITLASHKTGTIPYHFDVPSGSAPGGYYYTIFASATLSTGGVANTVQATDLVYLTVNGELTQVSHLKSSSIPWIAFGRNIPFTLNPINTGNVYSFVYVSSQLHGLFVHPPQTSSGHLLMPGKVRTLGGTIPSPILPGIYKATYGYKTTSNWVVQESHLVVFIPPWFIAFVLAALLMLGRWIPRIRSTSSKSPSEEE